MAIPFDTDRPVFSSDSECSQEKDDVISNDWINLVKSCGKWCGKNSYHYVCAMNNELWTDCKTSEKQLLCYILVYSGRLIKQITVIMHSTIPLFQFKYTQKLHVKNMKILDVFLGLFKLSWIFHQNQIKHI